MKRRLFFFVAFLVLVAALAAGCGAQPTVEAPQEELGAIEDKSAVVVEEKEATMTPVPTPEPTETQVPTEVQILPEAAAVVQLAVEDLADRLGVAPEEIQVVSVEAMEWSDASLGCPQPGMMYAQVITPGYQVMLEVDGQEYAYHTDTGNHVVLCEPEAASEIPAAPKSVAPMPEVEVPPEAEQAVKLAQQDLVSTQGLAPGAVRVVVVEPVDWSDSSLGCPQPGMMYAQVITPGFLVVLEADGQTYTYHTDTGRFVVLCEQESGASGGSGGTLSGEAATTPDPNSPYYSLVIKAVEDLVGRLASADVGQIDLLEVREVTWPDSSLGCPQPGMAYAQVPQEGLLIRLGVGRDMYFYHSAGNRDPFLCESTSRIVPKVTPKTDEFVPPPDSEIDSAG